MELIGFILIKVLEIYSFVVIAMVIVSWLTAFNVIDPSHPAAQRLLDVLVSLTEPVMRPIRRYIPPIGGIDLTPLVVIIGIEILKQIIFQMIYRGGF